MTPDEQLYLDSARKHRAGIEAGIPADANTAHDRLMIAIASLRHREDRGVPFLLSLLKEEPGVAGWVASHLLPDREPEAVAALEAIASGGHRFHSFGASMVLSEWRAGRLTPT
jgi:hypothetical protein